MKNAKFLSKNLFQLDPKFQRRHSSTILKTFFRYFTFLEKKFHFFWVLAQMVQLLTLSEAVFDFKFLDEKRLRSLQLHFTSWMMKHWTISFLGIFLLLKRTFKEDEEAGLNTTRHHHEELEHPGGVKWGWAG